ncbi:alternative ribosome rescue aminoacyl-tRNA hydrolase ArfB [Chloroflexota bacterium]
MIQITSSIAIDASEVQEEFIRSSGPGGQNANKVATTVQLRFDVANSHSLPDEVRERLISLARSRITEDSVLIINARRFRTQGRNRQDAIERLVELIRMAAEKPRSRRKTRPTLASKMRRLEEKHRRAETKKLRQRIQPPDE